MKAIILNSGEGKRLKPITEKIPKCLVKVNGKTILDYQLENLVNCGIKEIIITTGPFENLIKKRIKQKYPDLNIKYVNNPKYSSTNYIYSLWLTKEMINNSIILLHGDLIFDAILLKKLIGSKYDNCVLINENIKPPEKDFKGVIENEKVKKIGISFFGDNAFFLAPLYKFSKLDFIKWLNEIDIFIKEGKTKCYAEDAFNNISEKIQLFPLFYDKEVCMEIDDYNDIKIAKRNLSK
ncbi:MAG: phosphocholine cytidylyltransferase family protein [Candidatus Aenigmarchaeota archaeon]|nr:phosphocholine cytidylyltransferase family protein [Candidatus Aenigmarchaeota archaeon]